MKNWKYFLSGLIFFIFAALAISLFEPSPPLWSSTQVSGTKQPFLVEGIINGTLAVQEIILQKDYLNGVEIQFATMGKVNTNTNTLLVLDSNYNLLHQEKFSSKEIEDAKYHAFQFKENRRVGKGNKIYICLYSKEGDSANCIHPLFNAYKKIGNLYASIIINDDMFRSISNKARLYPGSMILRTYESDSSITSIIKWCWYILAVLLAFVIIFFKSLQSFLSRVNIRAEIVYITLALIFGPLYVFLNPPFQVPDEGSHMSRTYGLSEFHFSKTDKTVPGAIVKLDSTLLRLHFNPDEKTSKKEILSMVKVKIEPGVRKESGAPDYIVPYLPQLAGLAIGRMFSSSPLVLLYMGRFFNLILSILIVFLAIRITPFSKWLFFLLALMPKAIFLMASLSYDAFVISDSFLLIALFLYYAFKAEKLLWRDIVLILFLSMLLALCKPPYFIIAFLFLTIPFRKIRPLLKQKAVKFAAIFSLIIVFILLAYGAWTLIGGLIKSADAAKIEQVAPAAAPSRPEINPPRQINYIGTHLKTFVNLLIVTNFDQMRADMLDNFVGTMGWLDTYLPDIYINIYLILLLITALCIGDPAYTFDWKRKTLSFILFFIGILAIETAMYIYSSFVAQERLFGIQGRYFIPIAPLFLLIFYNKVISEKLDFICSAKRKSYLSAKPKVKPDILLEIQREQIFTKYLQVLIIGFTVVTLSRGIASILLRYYQW